VEQIHPQALQDEIERLRLEVGELRASRARFVLAGDAELQAIERDLHDGLQQQLVALAVNLQLAAASTESDPAGARELLEEMRRDVRQALTETAQLAERIYAPLLEAGGLAVALRSAAVSAEVPAAVDVDAGSSYPPELARSVYLCWLEALQHGGEPRITITVREEGGELTFEIASNHPGPDAGSDRLRERLEALGGGLIVEQHPGGGTRFSGSLPLAR
jgi:signal transduction histidine kinase